MTLIITQYPPHRRNLPCFHHSPGAGQPLCRSAAGAPDGLHTLEKWQRGSGPGSCFSPLVSLSHSMGFSVPYPLYTLLANRPLSRYTLPQPHSCSYPFGWQHPPVPAVPSAIGYAVLRPGTAGPLLGAQAGVPASGPGSGGDKESYEPIWSPSLGPPH